MKNTEFKYDLGDEAKDVITGFTGIIMGRTQWLTGCNHYQLQPRVDKDGKVPEQQGFDENRIQLTGKSAKLPEDPKPKPVVKKKPGGPQPTIKQPNKL